MKNFYLILIALLALLSCSNDEQAVHTEQPQTEMINLRIYFQQPTNAVTIQLYNEDGNVLNPELYTHNYQNAMDINLFINKGSKLTIHCYDEGAFSYNYKMYNSDGSVQFEGSREAIVEDILTKTYILQ